jgi:hypothetical protein
MAALGAVRAADIAIILIIVSCSWRASPVASASSPAALPPVAADVAKIVGHQDHAVHHLVGRQTTLLAASWLVNLMIIS